MWRNDLETSRADSFRFAAGLPGVKALNAGCQFPVASFAEFVDAGTLKIRGIYWDETSQQLLRAEVQHSVSLESTDSIAQSRAAGVALAQKIREQL